MVELINLQQQCLSSIQAFAGCSQVCPLRSYCVSEGCIEGDCSKCLNQIQYGQPHFSYSCKKITYHNTKNYYSACFKDGDNPMGINIRNNENKHIMNNMKNTIPIGVLMKVIIAPTLLKFFTTFP